LHFHLWIFEVEFHGVRPVGNVVEVPGGGDDGSEALLGDGVHHGLPVLPLPDFDDGVGLDHVVVVENLLPH